MRNVLDSYNCSKGIYVPSARYWPVSMSVVPFEFRGGPFFDV
jgi:hypothetical protein